MPSVRVSEEARGLNIAAAHIPEPIRGRSCESALLRLPRVARGVLSACTSVTAAIACEVVWAASRAVRSVVVVVGPTILPAPNSPASSALGRYGDSGRSRRAPLRGLS